MSTNIRCPKCETVMRVSATPPGAMVRCPKCQQTIRLAAAPAGAAPQPAAHSPAALSPQQPSTPQPAVQQAATPAAAFPAGSGGFAAPHAAPPGATRSAAAAATGDLPLRPFLVRFAFVMGGVTALLLALGLAGLAAESLAVVATVVLIVAMVAMLMTGQVWMAIGGMRQNPLLGIAIFFVPLVGLVMGVIQKGGILQGAIIYVSCLVPALMGVVFVGLYQSRYTAAGRADARSARLADDRPGLETMIRNTEQTVPADAPLATAKFRYVQIGPEVPITVAEAESILSPFQHYVKGSFQMDTQARTVQFDYRGPERLATQYRLLLYNRTQVMLSEVPGG